MGIVVRELEFRNLDEIKDYLKMEYGVGILGDESELKGVELNTILVNMEIEELEREAVLRLKKLVSLKAFLLSKEAGMDINRLLFNIDGLMKMSEDGLNLDSGRIVADGSLEEFFRAAGIEVSGGGKVLTDNKRSVKINKLRGSYDFNSIEEI